VSYLNSKAFVLALNKSPLRDQIEISLDTPSECAARFMEDRVDIGLVPVAVLPQLKSGHIISDYCISADGPVASVLLLSEKPIHQVEKIILDYQSRTSIVLARILADKSWNIKPEWVRGKPGFENDVRGSTAAVIIGDRALFLNDRFAYSYDLSEEWKKLTGLPFVFACWVANKIPGPDFQSAFNTALAEAAGFIPAVAQESATEKFSAPEIEDYLKKNVSFTLDEQKRRGLDLFLSLAKEYEQ
jgi:chorismate dehydratase